MRRFSQHTARLQQEAELPCGPTLGTLALVDDNGGGVFMRDDVLGHRPNAVVALAAVAAGILSFAGDQLLLLPRTWDVTDGRKPHEVCIA